MVHGETNLLRGPPADRTAAVLRLEHLVIFGRRNSIFLEQPPRSSAVSRFTSRSQVLLRPRGQRAAPQTKGRREISFCRNHAATAKNARRLDFFAAVLAAVAASLRLTGRTQMRVKIWVTRRAVDCQRIPGRYIDPVLTLTHSTTGYPSVFIMTFCASTCQVFLWRPSIAKMRRSPVRRVDMGRPPITQVTNLSVFGPTASAFAVVVRVFNGRLGVGDGKPARAGARADRHRARSASTCPRRQRRQRSCLRSVLSQVLRMKCLAGCFSHCEHNCFINHLLVHNINTIN
jgi:hypothetical protein